MQTSTIKSNIILIGFMGAGKTTLGLELAKELGWLFKDSDKEIEDKEGMSVAKIFSTKGEGYFRELESNFIKNFRLTNCVLATGGGMPVYNDNMGILKKIGKIVYIELSENEVIKRLQSDFSKRPKLKDLNDDWSPILQLLNSRKKYYEMADCSVSGENTINQVVKDIFNQLK